ncbi:MAG: major facilitator superfamily domain-containing protein [Linnemannia elongata]|nr:MAG: major facilitator superfamily domain-containing protein [Linnemannia elongata]
MHPQEIDHDPVTGEKLADPDILVPPPATLVLPAQVFTPEAMEQMADERTVLDEQGLSKPQLDVEAPFDGHNDVDNEQPYGWVVVAAAFFVQAIVIGTVNGYGVYQDQYITHDYNTSSTFQLAWVGTLNVVGMDLTGPITGQFADHFGYQISAFVGALIMGASLIATSFSTKVWQLYIFQGILYGLGASLAFFPSLSLPSQWFKKRRGFATGIVVAGGGFGGLIISPVTTALFTKIGYRWTVRTMAIVHLVILIPASALFRARVESGKNRGKRLKQEQSAREAAATSEKELKELKDEAAGIPKPKRQVMDFTVLKEVRFLILVVLSFFVANGYFNPYYFFPTYAQKNGVSVSTASLLIGVLNGSSALGRVTMGLASDYIGDINTLLISSLCASLSILVVWMLAGTSVVMMTIFCVLYGFFSGSFVAIVPTVAAHLCGISRLASMTGIVYGGIAVGTLIGSPVGGALLDLSQGVNYRPLQLWAGLVMVVGLVLNVILKFMMNPKPWGKV